MAFDPSGKTAHSPHCKERLRPECQCNTCKHDDFRLGTYIRCCDKRKKRCGDVCRSYEKE